MSALLCGGFDADDAEQRLWHTQLWNWAPPTKRGLTFLLFVTAVLD
jgi:hypothetical protein